MVTPLELLNLYYSDAQSFGNKQNKLWQKMDALLTWDNILNKGYQTDLCPLLYFIITKNLPKFSGKTIPDSVLLQLREHYNSSLARNMILLEELKRVVQKLKENNIKVVAFKGAYLTENVYENIACRPMGDLDILVRDEDREKSYKILRNMGYDKVPESHKDKMLHHSFSRQLMGHQVIIEIHHRLVKEVFMTNFDLDEIWGRDHMPIEHQIIYLSWHMLHHRVIRLIWICDLAELIKKNNKYINWDIVSDKSVSFNVQKYLMLSKHLISILINPSFSNNVYNQINYPVHRISELLFYKIQRRVMNKKNKDKLGHLLGMILMNSKDLIIYIPQYLRYRSSE